MDAKFNIDFLDEAIDFMNLLDIKAQRKIYYNLKKSQLINDPELFKKLTDNFGSFERCLTKSITVFLPFGIKQMMKILLY
jgi:hypothetical protein